MSKPVEATAEKRKAFKDWFDKSAARALAEQVSAEYPKFDQTRFTTLACTGLSKLEFSARVKQFSGALRQSLPDDTKRSLAILRASLPPPLPDCEAVTDGWLQWPVGQFIADYGLEHFDESMYAMTELTQRFSSEFAVRPFVNQLPEKTFNRLQQLCDDESPHVRRWCSEGTRPRLPWGIKLVSLVAEPKPILPILEALKDDPELYVRRSIANNLNDIAKDHPALVIRQCKKWTNSHSAHRYWIVNRALRSLIKAGDAEALAVVGFTAPKKIAVSLRFTPTSVKIGEVLSVTATLINGSASSQRLNIDYIVHHVRKNGSTSAKVFKWKKIELAPKETRELDKRHTFKQTSVRALYPGAHRIELQLNGQRVAAGEFLLKDGN